MHDDDDEEEKSLSLYWEWVATWGVLEINEENSFPLLFISSQVELVNVTMICESVKSYKKACVGGGMRMKNSSSRYRHQI